ncbi:zinc-binding protein A33 [Xyrauchen texanus]|uniref:zinc-binding protein A33 n=1 Tax=Xyrauchen texanus TaxID=154827 RepID=UPI0022421B52|nr:zinc-binding protein A33 [Xyrauchen texanus]
MADAYSFLEDDLTCVICCDVFTDPVTLKCSHTLCEKCLERFWSTRDVPQCPVCRQECSQEEPSKSLAFRVLCESFKKRKPAATVSDDVCPEHKETLKLFCFEDKRPICVVCYTSKNHHNHMCSPVEEAVGNLKEDLKARMEELQVTLADLSEAHDSSVKQAELLKEHSSTAENLIKKEFEKLHQFLREEEEKQIRSLRKEPDPQVEARMEEISTLIVDLSEKVAAVWQDMEAEDITFLQNYNETLKRLQRPIISNMHPQIIMKDKPQTFQTMIFTTWARMQNLVLQAPVTLDPDTASNRLLVSEDCSSVQHVDVKMNVSNHPQRLYVGVLATQGFNSGIHYWDVEVRNNNHWTLGVVGETVNRKKLYKMDPKSRFWCLRYVDGSYRKGPTPGIDIEVNERPWVIRVQLDFDKGELRFIDPFRSRSLCTFTGGFAEKVFPYFCTGDANTPINLYPANSCQY